MFLCCLEALDPQQVLHCTLGSIFLRRRLCILAADSLYPPSQGIKTEHGTLLGLFGILAMEQSTHFAFLLCAYACVCARSCVCVCVCVGAMACVLIAFLSMKPIEYDQVSVVVSLTTDWTFVAVTAR